MPSLQALYAQANAISYVGAIHGAPHLSLLNLSSNRLATWEQAASLELLTSLRRLDLHDNPLEGSQRQGYLQVMA